MCDSASRERLLEQREHGTVLFPFAVYEWDGSCPFSVGLHWHTETELIFLEQGSFSIVVDMQTLAVPAPAFVCVSASSIHGINRVCSGRERAVVFDPAMLSFKHYDDVQSQIVQPLLENRLRLPELVDASSPCFSGARVLFNRICAAGTERMAWARLSVKAGLLELLALFAEHGLLSACGTEDSGGRELSGAQSGRIRRMLAYIQAHYREHITVADMAGLLDMNCEYFCRFFKKHTGRTFTEYMNELRIEACAKQIAETPRKVIDIAMDNGFGNIGYFMTRFKEAKHMTPLAYRRLARDAKKETEPSDSTL